MAFPMILHQKITGLKSYIFCLLAPLSALLRVSHENLSAGIDSFLATSRIFHDTAEAYIYPLMRRPNMVNPHAGYCRNIFV